MNRLNLTDDPLSMMVKMAEGNPGAAVAIGNIMKENEAIDPQADFGGVGTLLGFDDQGIYGTSIYVLWSDKCGKDTRRLLMLLRASQLGFFPSKKIFEMSQDRCREINLTEEEFLELDNKVTERLEEFQKGAA